MLADIFLMVWAYLKEYVARENEHRPKEKESNERGVCVSKTFEEFWEIIETVDIKEGPGVEDYAKDDVEVGFDQEFGDFLLEVGVICAWT